MNDKELPWKVNVIESEAGWGRKIDEVRYFETKDKAITFKDEFNSHNTSTTVPSWYMVAEGPFPNS